MKVSCEQPMKKVILAAVLGCASPDAPVTAGPRVVVTMPRYDDGTTTVLIRGEDVRTEPKDAAQNEPDAPHPTVHDVVSPPDAWKPADVLLVGVGVLADTGTAPYVDAEPLDEGPATADAEEVPVDGTAMEDTAPEQPDVPKTEDIAEDAQSTPKVYPDPPTCVPPGLGVLFDIPLNNAVEAVSLEDVVGGRHTVAVFGGSQVQVYDDIGCRIGPVRQMPGSEVAPLSQGGWALFVNTSGVWPGVYKADLYTINGANLLSHAVDDWTTESALPVGGANACATNPCPWEDGHPVSSVVWRRTRSGALVRTSYWTNSSWAVTGASTGGGLSFDMAVGGVWLGASALLGGSSVKVQSGNFTYDAATLNWADFATGASVEDMPIPSPCVGTGYAGGVPALGSSRDGGAVGVARFNCYNSGSHVTQLLRLTQYGAFAAALKTLPFTDAMWVQKTAGTTADGGALLVVQDGTNVYGFLVGGPCTADNQCDDTDPSTYDTCTQWGCDHIY